MKYKMNANRSVNEELKNIPFRLQGAMSFPVGQSNFECLLACSMGTHLQAGKCFLNKMLVNYMTNLKLKHGFKAQLSIT